MNQQFCLGDRIGLKNPPAFLRKDTEYVVGSVDGENTGSVNVLALRNGAQYSFWVPLDEVYALPNNHSNTENTQPK